MSIMSPEVIYPDLVEQSVRLCAANGCTISVDCRLDWCWQPDTLWLFPACLQYVIIVSMSLEGRDRLYPHLFQEESAKLSLSDEQKPKCDYTYFYYCYILLHILFCNCKIQQWRKLLSLAPYIVVTWYAGMSVAVCVLTHNFSPRTLVCLPIIHTLHSGYLYF